jgi:hypothetical protein
MLSTRTHFLFYIQMAVDAKDEAMMFTADEVVPTVGIDLRP